MLATMKAQEGDLVELTQDLPKYGLKCGQRGFVLEAFESPNEAYDIEFEDEEGEFLGFAYSVKPEQVINIYAIAKEAFERGLTFINEGEYSEAEREFQRAIDLVPALIVKLHNWLLNTFGNTNESEVLITALRLVLRLNPDYEVDGVNMGFFARNNLAMAYQNYAAKKADEGDIETAISYFGFAMEVGSKPEIVSLVRRNLAKAYTSLGVQAALNEKYVDSLALMNRACEVDLNDMTGHNLRITYALVAKQHLDKGDYETAIIVFEHTIDLGPIFPELLNNYAVALARTQHREEAILVFQRAIKLAPDNEIIRHNLRLAEMGTTTGYNIEEIKANFSLPPMEQQREYSVTA